jgi:uncharacterized protein
LLFIDFYAGDPVTLIGSAEVIWDGPGLSDFRGAERLLRITVAEALYFETVLSWQWTPPEPSSRLKGTGDWQTVASTASAHANSQDPEQLT